MDEEFNKSIQSLLLQNSRIQRSLGAMHFRMHTFEQYYLEHLEGQTKRFIPYFISIISLFSAITSLLISYLDLPDNLRFISLLVITITLIISLVYAINKWRTTDISIRKLSHQFFLKMASLKRMGQLIYSEEELINLLGSADYFKRLEDHSNLINEYKSYFKKEITECKMLKCKILKKLKNYKSNTIQELMNLKSKKVTLEDLKDLKIAEFKKGDFIQELRDLEWWESWFESIQNS
ncbi:MAG: hypothetical protein ACTSR2_06835 [Candidatus Hodarchaeales archaeon]